MLRKRIVGVITVKDGWAVQSMGYRRYLPLGRPEILALNLDRWGADEIVLQCIDRTSTQAGPDIAMIERVAQKGLTTPLIYLGGIHTAQQAVAVVHAGADRIAIDAMLTDEPSQVHEIEANLGAQAIIAALPLSVEPAGLMHRNYRTGALAPLSDTVLELMSKRIVSEVMTIDWRNDGGTAFDTRILDTFPLADIPLIAFGGLAGADQLRGVLTRKSVVAAAVGNTLNYREHAIRHLKKALGDLPIRAPSHERRVDH
ncbi:HisA/HisF-related TIM barrel protein [Devosia aquimaris]|uniref:HisA/HisF-related TIM barrel protein n=1 Tax=Devosia aquimaris TaxID=2866214 RepID=UPI001CD05714|nr:HisA/HisF-related TIM barrel protein [Devosia sp. CJK-A8-3]